MGVKITEGVFVPGWNSLCFEEWVSMSAVWKKAPTVTLSQEGPLRLDCGSGDRKLYKIQSIQLKVCHLIPEQG